MDAIEEDVAIDADAKENHVEQNCRELKLDVLVGDLVTIALIQEY